MLASLYLLSKSVLGLAGMYAARRVKKHSRREQEARKAHTEVVSTMPKDHRSPAYFTAVTDAAETAKSARAETQAFERWDSREDKIDNLKDNLTGARRRIGYFAGAVDSTILAGFALYYNGIDVTALVLVRSLAL
jgi:hypothetical protein